MAGKNHNALYTITIEASTGMMMIEGQGVIGNAAPGVVYSRDHWLRCTVFVPWSHRVKINGCVDVVIQMLDC
jgi:hypothetical protein